MLVVLLAASVAHADLLNHERLRAHGYRGYQRLEQTGLNLQGQRCDLLYLSRLFLHCPAELSKPVSIGKDVWLGANVVVLAGVEIGDGAVVAANAVVTKSIPCGAVVARIPAQLLYFRHNRDARKASV